MPEERREGKGGGEGERHFLLAVDDSEASRRALFYAADLLGRLGGLRITLLHVMVLPQEDFFATPAERRAWREEREKEARALLARGREVLVQGGMPEGKVSDLVVESEGGKIASHVAEVRKLLGSCTVILGRSAKSRKEEFIFGSVSSQILHLTEGCSVWAVS